MRQLSYWIRFVLLCFCLQVNVGLAENTVRLLSGEKEPYIGAGLDGYGYVYEVVQQAFARAGYKLEVSFYPWARANHLATTGRYDGIMPVHQDSFSSVLFTLSAPFPGDEISLLRRKGVNGPLSSYTEGAEEDFKQALADKDIGVVRGSHLLSELQRHSSLHHGNNELNNLDMLYDGRLDLIVTDRFTAAKTIIDNRPQYIGQMAFLQPPLAQDPFHIAFSNKSGRTGELVVAFNRELNAMQQDGSLQRIRGRHGLLALSSDETEDKQVLTIATVSNPDMTIMRALSAQFAQRYPDVTLEWMELSESVLRRRLLGDLALDSGQFDVMIIGNYEVPIWAERGWLTALQEAKPDYQMQDILPRVRTALTHNEKLYALPFYAESVMTYYRRDLFEQAGISMPANPSYQDIKRLAGVIHNPGEGLYGICLRGKPGWGENMALVTSMVTAYGGQWFDNAWLPQLTQAPWQRAVSDYRDLLSSYGPPEPWTLGYTENLNLFAAGRCGIWIDATVAAGQLFNPQFSKVAGRVEYAPAPVDKRASDWLWVWALAIPESSRNKLMAERFIRWATSERYIRQVAKQYGWISVPAGTRLSTYHSAAYIRSAPFAGHVLEALQAQIERPSTLPYSSAQFVTIPEYVAIGTTTGQYMAELLKGNMNVQGALRQAQQFTEKQMRLSGYTD